MKLCVISDSPRWPGTPLFQVEDPDAFYRQYSDFVSRHLVLSELFMLGPFIDRLERDGWQVHIGESAKPILADYERWSQPLEIEGFRITKPDGTPGELFGYQSFALRRAIERAEAKSRAERFFFWGFCAGGGKSAISAAGARELFNRDLIDVTLAFTLKTLRRSLFDFFTGSTELKTVLVEGDKPKRRKQYEGSYQVYILNYDKAHWDYDQLLQIVEGKRVLFVMDEAQKILTDNSKTLARKGIDKLVKSCTGIVWPMSASVVQETPLNYRDVFNLDQANQNPLGTRAEFEERYCESKRRVEIPTKRGYSFWVTYYSWNNQALQEVRHRVADRTQSVRKTDPGVRENFKGLAVEVVPIELSSEDRKLYDYVRDMATEARKNEEPVEPYLRVLRYICNTPEALLHSESPIAQQLRETHGEYLTSKNSTKLETLVEQVKSIRDAGDKVVIFTQWTHLSLLLLSKALTKAKIKHVNHFGSGMTDRERDQAVHDFKHDKSVTVFLSSDAGACGLSFQMSRYVINYESPFSYDMLMQRNNRIDRADSYLDGLTSYIYVTKDSVEERIWSVNNSRRALADATTGAKEVLSYAAEADPEMVEYLVFGE